MSKPILISGIQPTGRLHLGNYLGSLQNFVKLQNENKYNCFFFIADYHSLTIEYNSKEKTKQILEVANDYLAVGIDPKKSTIFVQSQVPESTELAWILNTIAPLGELERMTQFKDKIAEQKSINAGLLTYPALMAADIILYDAKFVPVGEDQLQHLELARTLAKKFNAKFPGQTGRKTFIEPQALLAKTPKIMSLDNPLKKMSKSLPSGCLFLNDSPEEIKSKISRAVTDSGNEIKMDEQNKPGISNLLKIYNALSDISIPELEKKYTGKGYGIFKSELATTIIESLKPFRKNIASNSKLLTILNSGAKKAQKIASVKIKEVKKNIGINL